jgi:GNAT superfamily N-acetyltransferase
VSRRIVYSRSLEQEVAPLPARTAVVFRFDPPLDPPGPTRGGVPDYAYRGIVDGREAYHMQVSLDRAAIARLVPDREIPARTAFFFDCATDDAFRGLGLYPAALTTAMAALRSAGATRAYIRVHRSNLASIAGIRKAGFSRCGVVVHVAAFGFSIGPLRWRSPGARRRGREPA